MSRSDPPGIAKGTQEVVRMRRIRWVVALAAMTATMALRRPGGGG